MGHRRRNPKGARWLLRGSSLLVVDDGHRIDSFSRLDPLASTVRHAPLRLFNGLLT
jgi:hypothetical protein